MWFRNLSVYRLTQPLVIEQAALDAALAQKLARACACQEMVAYGFISPFDTKELLRTAESPALSHWSSNAFLIAAHKESRNLPASAIKDEVDLKVKAIEQEQQRSVYRKERDQIKDEIIQAMLPRAFIKRSNTFAYFDLDAGLVFVNTSSPKNAEDLLSTLREVLGSLPIRPVSVKVAPTATMTEWLKAKQATPGLTILGNCTLKDTGDGGGSVRCRDQDLSGDEVSLHLSSGKMVTELDLAYENQMSFTLNEKLGIKKLRFEDLLLDQAKQTGGDDKKAQLDASFTLMVLTNRKFVPELLEALGGEEMPQGI